MCDKGACGVPKLFCAALELAMSEWRLDLRFADDVFIFANTKEKVQNQIARRIRPKSSKPCVLKCLVQARLSKRLASGHEQMSLKNLRLPPTVEYQQPRFYLRKNLRSKGVLQCFSHDVALPAGGHQVDVRLFPRQDMQVPCQAAVKKAREKQKKWMLTIGKKMCWSHIFWQHVKLHD